MTGRKVKVLDNGALEFNPSFFQWFELNGIFTVHKLMSWPDRETLKNLIEERHTMKIRLPGPNGVKKDFIVKQFRDKPFLRRFVESIHPLRRRSGARQEWDAMWLFQKLGLPGPVPAALGRERGFSVVVSEAVPHVMKLDEWAEKNKVAWEMREAEALSIKRHLIRDMAKIVGRMHANGLHHQDLYLCHFLCGSEKYGTPLTLIDLQRVRRHRKLPKRWQVKDLAQLHFSSREFVNNKDIALFWHVYKETYTDAAYVNEKSLAERILKKSKRIMSHTLKHGL